MTDAGRRADALVVRCRVDVPPILHVVPGIAAERDEHALPDRHRVGAEGHCLRHIRAGADAARDDELHLLFHVQLFQRIHGLPNGGERGNADVLDERHLCRRRSALHAIDHDHIRAGVHSQLHVVKDASGADLHVNGLFPIRHLAQLANFDGEIVGAGPVRMTARRALVDALGQRAHLRNARADLLPEQHPATARLCALPDHDFDGVGFAQIVGVEAVAGRQALINECLRGDPLFRGHAAIAGRRARAELGRGAAQRFLHVGRQRTEAHAGDGDRDIELDRLRRETRSQHRLRAALLAIPFERIA